MMNENDWIAYNAAESNGISYNESIMVTDCNVSDELCALDEHMVRASFAGQSIAGERIDYTFNRYGQLNMSTGKYEIKGSTRKAVLSEILNNVKYYKRTKDTQLNNNWTLLNGILFPNGARIKGAFLVRNQNIIGFYKAGSDVGNTISWYENNVYHDQLWSNFRVHKLRSYKPESKNDIYKDQEPEFTREDELEDIAEFLSSMASRRLSAKETQILQDIRDDLNSM